MDFEKKVTLQAKNSFPPKSDIREALDFVLEQKVPGELVVSIPGNGGVTAIVFVEKARVLKGEIETVEK